MTLQVIVQVPVSVLRCVVYLHLRCTLMHIAHISPKWPKWQTLSERSVHNTNHNMLPSFVQQDSYEQFLRTYEMNVHAWQIETQFPSITIITLQLNHNPFLLFCCQNSQLTTCMHNEQWKGIELKMTSMLKDKLQETSGYIFSKF